jgi:hypothetical protein
VKSILKFIGIIVIYALAAVLFGAFFAIWVTLIVAFIIFFLAVYGFDMPITIQQDGKKIGTYRRSTGFIPSDES